MQGLAPHTHRSTPYSQANWWTATLSRANEGWSATLELTEDLPVLSGITGLDAPCSLPQAFRAALGDDTVDPRDTWKRCQRMTVRRLIENARRFAKSQPRGHHHPRRDEAESDSALERRRLAAHHASLPLLGSHAVWPWDIEPREDVWLFEVDTVALLRRWGFPDTGVRNASAGAVEKRAAILDAITHGACGDRIAISEPAHGIASFDALRAILAAAAALWFSHAKPRPHGSAPFQSGIPLP